MKAKKVLCIAVLLYGAGLVFQVRAQAYAPDTEYHDAVQRMFVVEAARVLAWRANQTGERIAEVAYQVAMGTNPPATAAATSAATNSAKNATAPANRNVIWDLKWLGADGKAVKSAKVEYPEALLKQGADFYRQTFQQLWAVGWKTPPMKNCAALEESFWQGAAQADWSREKSLIAAYGLLKLAAGPDQQDWISQMSGLLIHAALPGVAGNLTLDRVLVARGAAWLALAEKSCTNTVARPWSPVLFLAERERAAAKAWETNPVPEEIANEMTEAWSLWLRRPTSKEAYLFAVDSNCRPISLAMLAYDVQANGSGDLFAETVETLAGSEKRLTAWHNYGPLLARWAGVGGGRILEGEWPAHQRRAWLELLKEYRPAPEEKPDFRNELQAAAPGAKESSAGENLDACLTGFTNFAPLLRLGHSEGAGKLAPTAVATARDLLNYGWEATGLQVGERYRFVRWCWGVPELAKPILQTVTREVQGLMPFFLNAEAANSHNYQESLRRLQTVDGFQIRMGWSPNPFSRAGKPGESAEIFLRRCWLRSSEFEWQARSLWDEGKFNRMTDLVEAIKSESGPLAASRALGYLTSVGSDAPKPFWRVAKANPALAEMLSQPTVSWVRAVWNEKFGELSPLAKAQELEKTYWRNTECGVENWVVHYYSHAGAFKAARRFYLQARENFLDTVAVAGGVGQSAFVLGYCLQDDKLRELALSDSACASYKDMTMHIWDAAIRNDRKKLKTVTGELIARYESTAGEESNGRRLRDFLPLLDALADPQNPRHKEAVDHFGHYGHWIFLRWIWVEKFKLSQEDAITFLGGREAGPALHALVCGLEDDAPGAKAVIDDMITQNKITAPLSVIASYVCRKAAKESVEADLPDLKPPGATSTRAAVLARLKAKRR